MVLKQKSALGSEAAGLFAYLGGVHNLLANVHLPEPLEDSQKGYVQALPGHLVIASRMEAAAHEATSGDNSPVYHKHLTHCSCLSGQGMALSLDMQTLTA